MLVALATVSVAISNPEITFRCELSRVTSGHKRRTKCAEVNTRYLIRAWDEQPIISRLNKQMTTNIENKQLSLTLIKTDVSRYIEDITWPRGDTKFLFECWKIFQHEKRNFVSPSGHVMFYLLYNHQWNTKPFHWNSFILRKARFIM